MDFNGKVAIVTGASSGIGLATAKLFVKHGATVALADVSGDAGHEAAQAIREAGGRASFYHCDVANPADCMALVHHTVTEFGRLDVACNNAGIAGESAPTADYSVEGWNQVIGINLSGVFYGMKYQIPAMLKTGGGAIVNVASILGQVAFAGAPAYTAAKHGVVGLTKCTAIEYATQGIRVNSIGPAFIQTPMIAQLDEDPAVHDQLVSMHPMGRLGTPEEVAELIVWLSSPAASFVTGSYHAVDGGYLSR